jgi:quinol monooxygenase YgiN
MYLFVAEVLTKPGAARRYEALLREVVHALSDEPCFVRFTIGRSLGDPRLFLLHEIWTSRDEYERLRGGRVFRDYLARRTELVEMISHRDWQLVEEISPRMQGS